MGSVPYVQEKFKEKFEQWNQALHGRYSSISLGMHPTEAYPFAVCHGLLIQSDMNFAEKSRPQMALPVRPKPERKPQVGLSLRLRPKAE